MPFNVSSKTCSWYAGKYENFRAFLRLNNADEWAIKLESVPLEAFITTLRYNAPKVVEAAKLGDQRARDAAAALAVERFALENEVDLAGYNDAAQIKFARYISAFCS